MTTVFGTETEHFKDPEVMTVPRGAYFSVGVSHASVPVTAHGSGFKVTMTGNGSTYSDEGPSPHFECSVAGYADEPGVYPVEVKDEEGNVLRTLSVIVT